MTTYEILKDWGPLAGLFAFLIFLVPFFKWLGKLINKGADRFFQILSGMAEAVKELATAINASNNQQTKNHGDMLLHVTREINYVRKNTHVINNTLTRIEARLSGIPTPDPQPFDETGGLRIPPMDEDRGG